MRLRGSLPAAAADAGTETLKVSFNIILLFILSDRLLKGADEASQGCMWSLATLQPGRGLAALAG